TVFFILSLVVSVGLVFPSISMPIMFRFGYAKGKILFMCLGGLIGASGAFIVNAGSFVGASLALELKGFLPLILITCSVVIFALSCLLSVKLYQKREF
ncbi:MAG: ABC-2 transporter permease, partial [Eubacterium sp.]|nr:ABC-2 transporter permease [Eubacterium sp.]